MLDGWLDDLPERLLTHFVGGAWRAPLGGQMQVVLGQGGRVLGGVVCATPADLGRAHAAAQPWDPASQSHMAALLRHAAPHLARDLAQVIPDAPDHKALLAMADTCAATGRFGPWLRCECAAGALLVPDTRSAVLGVAIARLAQNAGVQPGKLALLHAPMLR